MSKGNIIPSYDLYKKLDASVGIEFSKLEESYNPYDTELPHRHNYYEILYFLESGGSHEIDFDGYPIQRHTIHFISPEQVHLLKREKHVTGYVLSFTRDFVFETAADSEFVDSFPFFNNPVAAPVVCVIDEDQQRDVTSLFLKIKAEFSALHHDRMKIMSSYLNILLISAKRIYEPQQAGGKVISPHADLIRKFKLLVDKNFLKEKSVSHYAQLLNITAGHLNDSSQKSIGKTASDIIHERVILEAKRHLYHSEKSVKEIGYALNYDDPSYFVKFFKTHSGMTPEEFRRHIREKYH